MADDGRNRALDGLRGVAAGVVLVSHLLLACSPALADSLLQPVGPAAANGNALERLLIDTPLHVLWGGPEAVMVFFALSGFVLALPMAAGRELNPVSYYPRRIARLYLPVWGSLPLAAAVHLLGSREPGTSATWWLDAHTQGLGAYSLAHELTLVRSAGDWAFNSVLWSLRWEVYFSLALPLALFAIVRARRYTGIGVLLCIAAILASNSQAALYLPVFVLGSILAFERERLSRLPRATSVPLAVIAVLGLSASGWLDVDDRLQSTLVVMGAFAALILTLVSGRVASGLQSRPMQWLGTRSFSLYLVHEPIVVAAAFLLGGEPHIAVLAAISLPVVLLVTEAFFRLVEMPAHRFSRAVGHWFDRNDGLTIRQRMARQQA